MLDVDQRVADGLRDLAGRAPVEADVWSAAERYVARHRRRRHAITGALVAVALVGGGLGTAVVVRRGSPSKAVVATPSGRLAATGPVDGSFTITASPNGLLTFSPSAVTVTTGIYAVTLVDGSNTQHTLGFADPETLSSRGLIVNTAGERKTARVYFGRAGSYTFYCGVTGHWAAGMFGTVNVTGPTITLAQAVAASTSSAG